MGAKDERPVLVPGASGFMGRLICPLLESRGIRVRAFGRRGRVVGEDVAAGELENPTSLRNAAAGVDTILHLAACSDDADFVRQLVPANVIGVFNVFEAARLEGVRRVILAGSCQAALGARAARVGVDARFPTNHYGLTKLWAEDMGRLYATRYGISVLAVRLGWVVRSQAEFALLAATPKTRHLFLSHRDAQEFFVHCLRADTGPFSVVYAFSRQLDGEVFDMEPARRILGFEPHDTFPEGVSFEDSAGGGRATAMTEFCLP